MGKIVAIGGGEISKRETEKIDRYLIELSGKAHPRLLFLPTASSDSEAYIGVVREHFGSLGCIVDHLCLVTGSYSQEEIRERILSAEIIYVGGGDTVSMMRRWRELSVDAYLREAYDRGIVLSGLSAGSICWFVYGHSDSESFGGNGHWDYIRANGLGIIPASHCPHYNEEGREGYDLMVKGDSIPGIALENGTALSYIEGKFQLIKSDEGMNGYLFRNTEGQQEKMLIGKDAFEL